MPIPEYYDSRQHLNLSFHAYSVIESDKYDFLEKPSFAGILNLVFSSYYKVANANIESAVERRRAKLRKDLQSIDAAEYVIEKLADSYREELKSAIENLSRDRSFKFQLSRDNFDLKQNWHDDRNYSSFGHYFKAVIEEYAAKSFYDREEIVLRSRLDELHSAINSGCVLTLTIRSGDQKLKCRVRPYRLCTDSERNYHYLIGMSSLESEVNEVPASFRVSRIEKIVPSAVGEGKLTKEERNTIEEKLRRTGVQFLLRDEKTIRIRFTREGKRQFNNQLHLRPPCIETMKLENGGCECSFLCTDLQAEYYFFKFGAEAEIIAPPELRMRFQDLYREASGLYD